MNRKQERMNETIPESIRGFMQLRGFIKATTDVITLQKVFKLDPLVACNYLIQLVQECNEDWSYYAVLSKIKFGILYEQAQPKLYPSSPVPLSEMNLSLDGEVFSPYIASVDPVISPDTHSNTFTWIYHQKQNSK